MTATEIPAEVADALMVAMAKKMGGVKAKPGEFRLHGTATFDVNVLVKKGNKTTYQPTCKIKWLRAFAKFIESSGAVGQHVFDKIVECVKASLDTGDDGEQPSPTEETLLRVAQSLSKLPRQERDGQTSVEGFVELLDFVEVGS